MLHKVQSEKSLLQRACVDLATQKEVLQERLFCRKNSGGGGGVNGITMAIQSNSTTPPNAASLALTKTSAEPQRQAHIITTAKSEEQTESDAEAAAEGAAEGAALAMLAMAQGEKTTNSYADGDVDPDADADSNAVVVANGLMALALLTSEQVQTKQQPLQQPQVSQLLERRQSQQQQQQHSQQAGSKHPVIRFYMQREAEMLYALEGGLGVDYVVLHCIWWIVLHCVALRCLARCITLLVPYLPLTTYRSLP
jgi:hypothetical protein